MKSSSGGRAPSSSQANSASTAPVIFILGFLVAAAAWMLPVNIKSVSPALLQAAGEGTPSLGAYGRDLVDMEKIGPAALVLSAAKATDDPRVPALETALKDFG